MRNLKKAMHSGKAMRGINFLLNTARQKKVGTWLMHLVKLYLVVSGWTAIIKAKGNGKALLESSLRDSENTNTI
ncbi:hypothetical protein N9164_15140 [Draconibacterium sp.]|nr:hypothetical protein [Draconibacterium sp.]